jgi:hypothetical protein
MRAASTPSPSLGRVIPLSRMIMDASMGGMVLYIENKFYPYYSGRPDLTGVLGGKRVDRQHPHVHWVRQADPY